MNSFYKTPDSCATYAVEITAADSDLTNPVRALYVGTGGNVKVTTDRNSVVTFTNVQDGSILPVNVKRVWATGTSGASGFVGLV